MNALAKPTLAQAIHHSADTFRETIEPQQFPDLLTEKRPYVNTGIAAHWVASRRAAPSPTTGTCSTALPPNQRRGFVQRGWQRWGVM
ncbi:hypothetical protein CLU84_2382 [Comamonas sp. 26]|nr:hypothetical protein CLU84_2382 [Comamonas sp. 26]